MSSSETILCRLCGSKNGVLIYLFDDTATSLPKIEALVPELVILRHDSLPKYICHRCVGKIKDFYDFRETCIKTQEILRNHLPWMSTSGQTSTSGVNAPSPTVVYLAGPLAYPFGNDGQVEVLTLSDDEDESLIASTSTSTVPMKRIKPSDVSRNLAPLMHGEELSQNTINNGPAQSSLDPSKRQASGINCDKFARNQTFQQPSIVRNATPLSKVLAAQGKFAQAFPPSNQPNHVGQKSYELSRTGECQSMIPSPPPCGTTILEGTKSKFISESSVRILSQPSANTVSKNPGTISSSTIKCLSVNNPMLPTTQLIPNQSNAHMHSTPMTFVGSNVTFSSPATVRLSAQHLGQDEDFLSFQINKRCTQGNDLQPCLSNPSPTVTVKRSPVKKRPKPRPKCKQKTKQNPSLSNNLLDFNSIIIGPNSIVFACNKCSKILVKEKSVREHICDPHDIDKIHDTLKHAVNPPSNACENSNDSSSSVELIEIDGSSQPDT